MIQMLLLMPDHGQLSAEGVLAFIGADSASGGSKTARLIVYFGAFSHDRVPLA
ncbi:hypothetical protein ACVFYP_00390 [Roseomonas sp. F4]